ncbi:MAG: hypothetical protein COB85_01675 [Bacteroidetes bacterium]|nr:MAG: hypothetical protein COB85_01675 [Bacteroidota bacterium]
MSRTQLISTILLLLVYGTLCAQTRTKIKIDELPSSVTIELQNKYKKYDIKGVEKTDDKEHGILYLVNVKKKSKEFALSYNRSGELIRASRVYTYQDSKPRVKSSGSHDGHNHQH